GGAYTDVAGNLWSADSGCNTGILNTIPGPIQGTLDETLFLTTRWDEGAAPEMTCSYAVSPGLYQVTLYFTESNSRNFRVGARVFDVDIEGVRAFDNLDIYREAGSNTALLKTTTVSVTDGQIDIRFLHQVKNPLVKAIAIVPAGNNPPVISTSPVTGATVGSLYRYDVNVSDDAGDTQQYFLDVAPVGMSIDPGTGVISWTPGAADAGSHPVTVRVRDQGGLEDTQSWSLDVTTAGSNNPPVITSAPVLTATAGQSYRYDVKVTDDAGDTQQYFLDVAPVGMSIDPDTGTVSWVPGSSDLGQQSVTVRVRDQGGLEDTQSWTLTVSAAVGNNPPVITSTPVLTATEGQSYRYDVNVTDDVGDTQQYFLDTAPTGMGIDPNSGIVSWVPGAAGVGQQSVTVRVRDQGGLEDTQSWTLTVSAAVGNNPPVITTTPVIAAKAGTLYRYDVNVTDDAGDTWQYFLDTAPTGMSIDPGTGVVSWTPGAGDVGGHPVTVRVQDQGGLEDSQSWTLTVGSADQQPVRVNIGGAAYTDSAGNLWAADYGCNTGILNTIPGPIQGTPDETLFLTTRWDEGAAPEMTCSYPVSPGLYEVTLYFTESNSKNFRVGARVFDVSIEGLLEFDNLDIYKEAGSNTALLKTTRVNVTDGQIDIRFLHQVKNPLVKAIQIREVPVGACAATPRTQALNGVLPVSGGTGSGSLLFSIPPGGNGTLGTATIVDASTGQFRYQPDGSGWGSDSFQYQVEGLPGGTVINIYTVIIEPRMMPLGDSITTGVEVGGNEPDIIPTADLRVGWRLPLYNDLVAEGYAFDFVGGQNHGWGYSPFDSDHEGHGGWTATDIAWGKTGYPTDGVRAWLDANPADIILLHAGTNGLVAGGDIEVEAILDEIDLWEASPGGNPVTVILAQIIDQNPLNPVVSEFNANLLAMANDRISNPANSAYPDQIVVIDQQSALLYPGDLQDKLHPKPAGYVKMKDRWKEPLNLLLPLCP
ncbi:MAG TPA: hypothetical protein ENK49_02295, partial [Gammaproteobacteria bacterium]|nr:hypothetical protein [Gammaproteobacteria bacterium]